MRFPSGLAIDWVGKVFIADSQNNRIRLLAGTSNSELPPTIQVNQVVGPSAFGSAATAPGSWIEIYGSNMSSVARSWSAQDFDGTTAPHSLSGTSVTIAGRDAFVSYVSPYQVNALVPFDVAPGQQTVTITTSSGTSASGVVTVNATQPGLLAPASFKINSQQYAGATFPDGTYAIPSLAISGVASRPARPSETIILYGIGFGEVTPYVNSGEIVQTTNSLNHSVEITIGGLPARVTYAGLAPGSVGLYQFNVVVPELASSDAVPLTYSLDGIQGTQTLYIAVRN